MAWMALAGVVLLVGVICWRVMRCEEHGRADDPSGFWDFFNWFDFF